MRQDSRRSLEQTAFRGRHGRRRLRRQGRHRHRAARDPRRDADGAPGALCDRPRGGDAILRPARRRAHLDQGRRRAGRTDSRTQDALHLRQRRLYAALELRRRQVCGASAGALYDPERPCRCLLRLHQSRAGNSDARLRRDGGRLRHRMPDGQARPSRRHGSDGVPNPQRLSRRRHEGASTRGEEHGAHRVRPGRRRKGWRIGEQYKRISSRRDGGARAAVPPARRDSTEAARLAAAQQRTTYDRPQPSPEPPRAPPPQPAPATTTHGATRFSSVFGRRR